MSRINNPITFFNDEKGRTLPKATLDFYESGTFTRKDTYSDSALSAVNPNPVVADGAGRFPDIFLASGEYRAVLKDRDGVEIATKDNLVNQIGDGEDIATAVNVTTATGTQSVRDAFNSRIIRVTGLSALKALPTDNLTDGDGARITTTGRAGDFYWDSSGLSAEVTADTQEGVYVAPDGQDGSNGAWRRDLSAGYVAPEMFGAVGDGVTDNTAAYDSLIASVPENYTIRWGDPDGVYVGNFDSTKGFRCDLNNATVVPIENGYGVYMQSESVQYDVIESELLPGYTSFTLSGVQTIRAGALIVLWDNAVRSTGGDVNFEIFEVASSSDDGSNTTVNIVGEAEAHKGAGDIVAFYFDTPLESPSIRNMRYENDNSLVTLPAFYIRGAKNPTMETGYAKGTIGHAFRMEESMNCVTRRVYGDRPLETTSGRGYIATAPKCKNATVEFVIGRGSRHAVDMGSCYGRKTIRHIRELDAKSSVVLPVHNGFGSGAEIYDVEYYADEFTYGVYFSDQGFNNALKEDHSTPHISVRKVRGYINRKVDDFTHNAVYIRTNGETVDIEDIRTIYSQEDTPTVTGSSHVRIDGSFRRIDISRVSGNVVGRPFFLNAEGAYSGVVSIKDVETGDAAGKSLIRGYGLNIDNYLYGSVGSDTEAVEVSSLSGNTPTYLNVGSVLPKVPGNEVDPVKNDGVTDLFGYVQESGLRTTGNLDISDTDVLAASEIFNRSALIKADTGTGAGTVTATLPDPVIKSGQKITIYVFPSRNTLEFTTGNTFGTISITEDSTAVLVSDNNLWRRIL